uniref:Uncharacterized protein n=1 Tax=Rhizophora mucronata TaxID=61149 RepID=A0A2P2N029_RHIMU
MGSTVDSYTVDAPGRSLVMASTLAV